MEMFQMARGTIQTNILFLWWQIFHISLKDTGNVDSVISET